MKKTLFAGMLLTGALLAGCSDDQSAEELEKMKAKYETLQQQYEDLSTQFEQLQEDYDNVVAEQEETDVTDEEDDTVTEEAEKITSLDQITPEEPASQKGPFKTLIFDENGEATYEVSNLTLAAPPSTNENVYELALKELFPELTFNKVIENEDQTITIDINENSTGSPNMTASAQVDTFLDRLAFFLYYNFPQLKAYNLYSNGEPTMLGDFGPFDEPIPNNSFEFNSPNFSLNN